MGADQRGEILRAVATDARTGTVVGRFAEAAERVAGWPLPDHDALWRWSIEDLDGFWRLASAELGVRWHTEPERFLESPVLPGARWCEGGRLNYAELCLDYGGSASAVVSLSQTREDIVVSRDELREQVERCAAGLRRLGVGRGSRVAGYLPDIAETIVAFLAAASLGATWACCAPEFGTQSVTDRLAQFEPDVLIVIDGYGYGRKPIDRAAQVAAIRTSLPTVRHTVVLPYLDPATAARRVPEAIPWSLLLADREPLRFASVPFDHPLYVLFTSGTTGLPKPIVHGHGGIALEHAKLLGLSLDVGEEDVFFWFSTTGWMVWNLKVSMLLRGATVVCLDGDPAFPDGSTMWGIVERTGTTVFGASAAFLLGCRKRGMTPGRVHDLAELRTVVSSGSPLSADGYRWVYEAVNPTVLLNSISGGTDVCSAFLGASPMLPVRAGELSGCTLGVHVQAYSPTGEPVVGERGELVLTTPMPSMPVAFLGDHDGSRLRSAYFERYPGAWCHGDWITFFDDGAAVISGRSDATLNRGGVRLGTAEFYAVIDDLDEVADSLVVHLEDPDGGLGEILLFLVPADPALTEEGLTAAVAAELRTRLSPRHVPDGVYLVPGVPRTLSGKKLEIPVKRILTGTPVAHAASPGALENPEVLTAYVAIATARAGRSA